MLSIALRCYQQPRGVLCMYDGHTTYEEDYAGPPDRYRVHCYVCCLRLKNLKLHARQVKVELLFELED